MASTSDEKSNPEREYVPHTHPLSAGRVIVWGGIGILLYVAHAAFVPVALALLLALILSGPVEMLHQKRVPRSVSALVILVLVLSAIGGVVAVSGRQPKRGRATRPKP